MIKLYGQRTVRRYGQSGIFFNLAGSVQNLSQIAYVQPVLIKRRDDSHQSLQLEHHRKCSVQKGSIVTNAEAAAVHLPRQIYSHQILHGQI